MLGPGTETDSLFASMVVPQLVLTVVSGSLTYVIIPIFANINEDSFGQELWNLFRGIAFIFIPLTVILYLTTNVWVPLTVPGFSLDAKKLTVSLTEIQLIGMTFTGLAGVLTAAYHAKQRFIWAYLSPGLSAFIGLIFLFWYFPIIGVRAAAWAMTIKMLSLVVLLSPILGPYKPSLRNNTIFKMVWDKLKPLLFGNIYSKTDQFLDRFLASMAPAGELSLFHLSQMIYGAGNQILNSAIVAPMVPVLAQNAKHGEWNAFRKLSKTRLLIVAVITCSTFLLFIFMGKYILNLFLKNTNFVDTEIGKFWWMLIALFGVWVGGALGQVLSSSFYAKGNTKTPTIIGIFGFTIGIALKSVGFLKFGVLGVAIGTTTYYFINAILLHISLYRKNK